MVNPNTPWTHTIPLSSHALHVLPHMPHTIPFLFLFFSFFFNFYFSFLVFSLKRLTRAPRSCAKCPNTLEVSAHTARASERNPRFLCTPRMLSLARALPPHSLAGKARRRNSPVPRSDPILPDPVPSPSIHAGDPRRPPEISVCGGVLRKFGA